MQDQLDNAVSMRNYNYQQNVGDVVNNFRNHTFTPNMMWNRSMATPSPTPTFVPSAEMYHQVTPMLPSVHPFNALDDSMRKEKESYMMNLSLAATAASVNKQNKKIKTENNCSDNPLTIHLEDSSSNDTSPKNAEEESSTGSKISRDLLE